MILLLSDKGTFTPSTQVKYWDGAAWQLAPVKVWNGSAWVAINSINYWNGSSWTTL